MQEFVLAVSKLKMGDSFEKEAEIGPLTTEKAATDVLELINNARKQGTKVLTGGEFSNLGAAYVEPTVLGDVTDNMRVFRDEIFGPVAAVSTFTTEEEAIHRANNTEYGLACYFYSRDIGRVWRVAESLEYGIVGINEGVISNEMAPFGGLKESAQDREGSKYGLDDYLEIKYLCMGGFA